MTSDMVISYEDGVTPIMSRSVQLINFSSNGISANTLELGPNMLYANIFMIDNVKSTSSVKTLVESASGSVTAQSSS